MKLPILIITVFAVTGCKFMHRHQKPQPAPPPMTVETASAVDQTVSRRMKFQSRLTSNFDATIQPRVAGYLLSKNYSKGMPVEEGQLLYTIDAADLRLTVAADQAALASAQVQLLEAQNNLNRAVPLARNGAISQSSLDQYRAAHASAKANFKSAESALKNSRINLGYATIYAPVSGIIDDTGATVGDYVGPGSKYATLSTISNTDIVCADIPIPFSRYLAIKEGAADNIPTYDNSRLLSDIVLTLSDGTVYPHKGDYKYTKKDAGNRTGTIIIVVAFPNHKGVLKIGQSASVTANVGAPAGAVLVPQRAVSQEQGMSSLWVVAPDSTVHFRKVVLGPTFGDLWIIDSGVKAGERVVVGGQSKLHNGERVIPKYIN